MITVKTKSGFAAQIDERKISNNMELLDLLVELNEGDWRAASRLVRLLLTEKQRKALYASLRGPDGVVRASDVNAAVMEIISGATGGKKS